MKTLLESFQWMLYILMGSIIIPVSIASTFGLDTQTTIEFVSRTLFVIGVAGILQITIGHKLPIIEGPAGIWWGVFVLYAGMGSVMFGSQKETLRVLEFCFILSGGIFILLSLLGFVEKLSKLFTPTVMGVYLVLLVLQLSGSFLKGTVGITSSSQNINPMIALLSFITVAISYACLKIKSLSSYATLISIAIGWLLFYVFGLTSPTTPVDNIVYVPEIFAFGTPRIESGMILNVFFLTVLLLTNLMASVRVVQIVFEKLNIKTEERLNKTSITSGVIHILSGAFGAIGPVPISGSAAFISQTGFTAKLPFILGNMLIIAISLSPICTSFFAALPPAVGYAALIPSFGIGTIAIAMSQLEAASNKEIRNLCIGVGWFIGCGIMFIPSTAFSGMSALMTSLMSNGLIVGAIAVIILEQTLTNKLSKPTHH